MSSFGGDGFGAPGGGAGGDGFDRHGHSPRWRGSSAGSAAEELLDGALRSQPIARTQLEELRERVDQTEREIFELQTRVASKKEDLDTASDALVTHLEMLRATEQRVERARERLRAAEGSHSAAQELQGAGSLTLDRLLELARRPWDRKPGDLLVATGNRAEFEKNVVMELSHLAAGMHGLKGKLADPFENERREVLRLEPTGRQVLSMLGVHENGSRTPVATVDVVKRSMGDSNAVVSVNLEDHPTFLDVLEYATQYWSLSPEAFSLVDADNVCWPLTANVRETFEGESDRTLYLRESGENEAHQTIQALGDARSPVLRYRGQSSTADSAPLSAAHDALNESSRRFLAESSLQAQLQGTAIGTGTTNRLELALQRTELEQHFKRGFRFSLGVVRYHCELLLFLLLVALMFNLALFRAGAYDAQPLKVALELALINTPFPCVNCTSQHQSASEFYRIDSSVKLQAYLLGPVCELMTTASSELPAARRLEMVDEYDMLDDELGQMRGLAETSDGDNYTTFPVLQNYNIVITRMLLQQVRVKSRCDGSCFPAMKDGEMETVEYGKNVSHLAEDVRKAFRSARATPGQEEDSWPWLVSDLVAGVGDRVNINKGGYFLELDHRRDNFTRQIKGLWESGWVDDQTRAILLTANIYNPNFDKFMVFIAAFQFTTSNGVIPKHLAIPPRMEFGESANRGGESGAGVNPRGTVEYVFVITALSLFGLFFFLFVYDFVRSKSKVQFIRNPLTLINLVLLALVATLIAFRLRVDDAMSELVSQMSLEITKREENGTLAEGVRYRDLRGVAFGTSACAALEASVNVLLVLKGIGYLQMNPELSLLSSSMFRTLRMANNYAFVFVICLIAFSIMGHFTIGREEFVFYSFDLAMFSTLQIFIGLFNFDSLSSLSPLRLWPVLFSFITFLFGYLGLYRVFFGIVSYSYSKAMDHARREGMPWLPAVNQDFRVQRPKEHPAIHKLRVAQRLGLSDGEPVARSSKAKAE